MQRNNQILPVSARANPTAATHYVPSSATSANTIRTPQVAATARTPTGTAESGIHIRRRCDTRVSLVEAERSRQGMSMKIKSEGFPGDAGRKAEAQRLADRDRADLQIEEEVQGAVGRACKRRYTIAALHYASDRFALLLIFQAMDAAGKDGAVRHVLSGVNPQGCEVFSFKQPSAEELEHDFLVAHDVPASRARAHRHLQPLLLRGGAGGARASGDSRQRATFRRAA
jgi:hypothetical protein